MTKLRQLKAERGVEDTLNTQNGSDTIQTLPLVLSFDSEVWIYREKKWWTGQFKVLGIVDTDIIVDTGNRVVTFWNTHIRPYNCWIKETDIINLETVNHLAEILVDKPVNEEIPMLVDYPKFQRPRQHGRP